MKMTLSAVVENKPGVLTRVAGLFSRRGFNINSLAVGPTENPMLSRMTIVVDQADHSMEQVEKQLHKLIDVRTVTRLDPMKAVDRELMLIKVHAPPAKRVEIFDLAGAFRAKIVDVGRASLIVEVTGEGPKLKAFQELMVPYGIIEISRTGKVALSRSK